MNELIGLNNNFFSGALNAGFCELTLTLLMGAIFWTLKKKHNRNTKDISLRISNNLNTKDNRETALASTG